MLVTDYFEKLAKNCNILIVISGDLHLKRLCFLSELYPKEVQNFFPGNAG